MKPNRLGKIVQSIHNRLPSFLHGPVLTWAFTSNIKYAGTTGIRIHEWTDHQAVVHLANKRPVQNHLKGIHATAMATLAESTTGMVFGLHVPDSHLPVLKRMQVHFKRRAQGDLQAVAHITPEQIHQIQNTDKGSTIVAVRVMDEAGKQPIECEFEWAWTSKHRKQQEPTKNTTSDDASDDSNTRMAA